MAVQAKDGSRHHSASRASLHDELSAKKGAATVTPMKKPEGGESSDKHPAPSSHSIEDHVSDHGPAHAIHFTHDQEGDGKHHVSSFHGEAEPGQHDHPAAHHSVHASHAAAHQHMGKAMGMDHDNEERPAEDDDLTPDSSQDQTAGSHGIPGLS